MNLSAQPIFIPLSALVSDLKEQGFVIGVDTWQDLYALLRKKEFSGFNIDRELLKTTLCPLFAVNEEQQQVFGQLFDRHFAEYYGQYEQPAYYPPFPVQPPRPPKDYNLVLRFILWGAFVLLLSGLLVYEWFELHPLQERIVFMPPPGAQNPAHFDPNDYTPSPTPPREQQPLSPAPTKGAAPFSYLPIYDPDLTYMEMHNFWRYRLRILVAEGGLWIVVGGSGVWLVFALYRAKKRRLQAQRRNSLEPLAYWPVKSDERIFVQLPHSFFQAGNSMRRRLPYSSPQLDIKSTVKATIAAGGRPSPRFTQRSRAAEYLVLLPAGNAHSMFTAYLDYLFGLLGKTDIVIHRYFYEGEPSAFYVHDGEKKNTIQSLLYHHGNCRLLLVAYPQQLLKSAGFISEHFRQWDDRAILTAYLSSIDKRTLNFLREDFPVLPAGIASLETLVTQWEEGAGDEEAAAPEPPAPFISDYFELKPQLLAYFEACNTGSDAIDLLRWFAACCLLPELHWDLMLFAAKHIPPSNVPLLRLENLEALCRLPWMAAGSVPGQVRDQLVHDDELLSPEWRDHLIAAIAELVEHNLPEATNSVAYDRRQLHLALLEAMLSDSERSKRERTRYLKRAAEQSGEKDEAVTLLLNRETFAPFGKLLNERLRKALYRDGELYNGLKLFWGSVLIAALGVVVLLLTNTERRYGNIEVYNSTVYFIDTPEKQAGWQNHHAAFYYNAYYPGASAAAEEGTSEHETAKALVDSAAKIAPGDAMSQLNSFIIRMNYRLKAINDAMEKGEGSALITTGQQLAVDEKQLNAITHSIMLEKQEHAPQGDSLAVYLKRVKTNFWMARYICASVTGDESVLSKAAENMHLPMLTADQRKLLEQLDDLRKKKK